MTPLCQRTDRLPPYGIERARREESSLKSPNRRWRTASAAPALHWTLVVHNNLRWPRPTSPARDPHLSTVLNGHLVADAVMSREKAGSHLGPCSSLARDAEPSSADVVGVDLPIAFRRLETFRPARIGAVWFRRYT